MATTWVDIPGSRVCHTLPGLWTGSGCHCEEIERREKSRREDMRKRAKEQK